MDTRMFELKMHICITVRTLLNDSHIYPSPFLSYDTGCWSYVGMQGGKQEINYPDWCIDQYGSVLHEMYHALGFFHEQSRFDRDDYVTIVWDNIDSGICNCIHSK